MVSQTAIDAFNEDLYSEHLEEAAFLYEQRQALVFDPELTWLDLEHYEQRFAAHLDALSEGGHPALKICLARALEGEPEELHTALCLFCRTNQFDLLIKACNYADLANKHIQQAIYTALFYTCPSIFYSRLERYATQTNPAFAPVFIKMVGLLRLHRYAGFLKAHIKEKSCYIALIESFGQLANGSSVPWLSQILKESEDEQVKNKVAFSLLRCGSRRFLKELTSPFPRWALLPIALSGQLELAHQLLQNPQSSPDYIQAVGFLWYPSTLPFLIGSLTQFGEASARALNLLTGANLFEEIFIEEEDDPDLLLDGEEQAPKRDKESRGEWITRNSQDPHTWKTWWASHQGQFESSKRYRNGSPFGAAHLRDYLLLEQSPNWARQYVALELLLQFREDVLFDLEQTINRQRQLIHTLMAKPQDCI